MTWVAVGVGVASLAGAALSSNATSNAASTAANSANNANQLQWNMFQQQQANQRPWINMGQGALGALGFGMGLFDPQAYLAANPDVAANPFFAANPYQHYLQYGQAEGRNMGQPGAGFGALNTPFSATDWKADPGFAFRLQQGQQALERAGAAKGMTLSGAQLRGLTDYGQGMGSQEYQAAYNRYTNDQSNTFNRLSSLAGTGQQANNVMGQFGMQTANGMGQNLMGAANMQGAAGIAGANAWGGALNNIGNGWMYYQLMGGLGGQPGAYSYLGAPGSPYNFGNNWGQPISTVPTGAPAGGTFNGVPIK